MMKQVSFLVLLAGWCSCQQSQTGETTATTFVLSDTMMTAVCIDTTVIRPVEGELRFSGEITADAVKEIRLRLRNAGTDIIRVKEGCAVEVATTDHPDKVLNGRIEKVHLSGNGVTLMRIHLNDEGMLLKPGMRVTVSVHYRDSLQMPAIPASAVILDKGKNFVVVFRDRYNIGTREVKVSRSFNDISYISNGLRPGEKVISRNQLLIYDALNH